MHENSIFGCGGAKVCMKNEMSERERERRVRRVRRRKGGDVGQVRFKYL